MLEDAAGVFAGVEVGDLAAHACRVAERVRSGPDLRFAAVKPEGTDAELVVAGLKLLPQERASPGIGGVIEGDADLSWRTAVWPIPGDGCAVVRESEHARVAHRDETVGQRADRRPDRDRRLDAEGAQFLDHPARIGPARRVEVPVAQVPPVQVVDHEHGQRQAAAGVLAGHLEQLVLVAVAQLALPEP